MASQVLEDPDGSDIQKSISKQRPEWSEMGDLLDVLALVQPSNPCLTTVEGEDLRVHARRIPGLSEEEKGKGIYTNYSIPYTDLVVQFLLRVQSQPLFTG
jgi:hypothetical protein